MGAGLPVRLGLRLVIGDRVEGQLVAFVSQPPLDGCTAGLAAVGPKQLVPGAQHLVARVDLTSNGDVRCRSH